MDKVSSHTAVRLYANRKGVSITDAVAQALRIRHYNVHCDIGKPRTNLIISKGTMRAVWDLSRIINMIATDEDGYFDQKLANPAYEMIKTNLVLTQQLSVFFIYMGKGNDNTKYKKLQHITDDGNILISILRSCDQYGLDITTAANSAA